MSTGFEPRQIQVARKKRPAPDLSRNNVVPRGGQHAVLIREPDSASQISQVMAASSRAVFRFDGRTMM